MDRLLVATLNIRNLADYPWLRGAVGAEDARLVFDRPAAGDPTLYPSDHVGTAARVAIG